MRCRESSPDRTLAGIVACAGWRASALASWRAPSLADRREPLQTWPAWPAWANPHLAGARAAFVRGGEGLGPPRWLDL